MISTFRASPPLVHASCRLLPSNDVKRITFLSTLSSPRARAALEGELMEIMRRAVSEHEAIVRDLTVNADGRVTCTLILRSGALNGEALRSAAADAIESMPWATGSEIRLKLATPPSFMGRHAPASLSKVGALVAVSSCKGGVGKSTVALNLACALASKGARVGLLDADVHGPSLPSLVTLPAGALPIVQQAATKLLQPAEAHGLLLMSYGYIAKGASINATSGAAMRGPMTGRVAQQMLSGTDWGALDYLLVDMPPGTGDVQLTLAQTYGFTAAVVVSTPQRVVLADVLKGIDVLKELKVPILAVIENMAFFTDESGKRHFPFGKSQLGAVCAHAGVDETCAFRLPLDPQVSGAADAGSPVVRSEGAAAANELFGALADTVVRRTHALQDELALQRNAQLRFDPARGVVLRFFAGPDEGRELVLPRKELQRLPGAPAGSASQVPASVELCEGPERGIAVRVRWEGGGESSISLDDIKRIAAQ